MSLLQLSNAIRHDRHNFEDIMSNPSQFQFGHPYLTADDIVNLYE
jgi:hypothetical protein